jgi:hypothetical protein
MVKLASSVIKTVNPDVMQEAADPDQVRVEVETGPGKELLSYPAHDQAVRIHKVERFRRGCVLLVQNKDFLACRDLHATGA